MKTLHVRKIQLYVNKPNVQLFTYYYYYYYY